MQSLLHVRSQTALLRFTCNLTANSHRHQNSEATWDIGVIHMKTQIIRLLDGDQKAMDWIRENLAICAHNKTLSKKLLSRFPNNFGALLAIVPDWIDIEKLSAYKYGFEVPDGASPYESGDFPEDLLVDFIQEYLCSSDRAVVVFANVGAIRKTSEYWSWGTAPPLHEYGEDEIYYILAGNTLDREAIASAVADSLGHFGVGVCSVCEQVPADDIPNEEFLDRIASNSKHILVPAFDDAGFIVWSPGEL